MKKKKKADESMIAIADFEEIQPANLLFKYQTPCCALCQMYNTDDRTTVVELKRFVEKVKAHSESQNWLTSDRSGGERAIYTITSPWETNLQKRLVEVGFEEITTFKRRKGYPEGTLTMYIYKF